MKQIRKPFKVYKNYKELCLDLGLIYQSKLKDNNLNELSTLYDIEFMDKRAIKIIPKKKVKKNIRQTKFVKLGFDKILMHHIKGIKVNTKYELVKQILSHMEMFQSQYQNVDYSMSCKNEIISKVQSIISSMLSTLSKAQIIQYTEHFTFENAKSSSKNDEKIKKITEELLRKYNLKNEYILQFASSSLRKKFYSERADSVLLQEGFVLKRKELNIKVLQEDLYKELDENDYNAIYNNVYCTIKETLVKNYKNKLKNVSVYKLTDQHRYLVVKNLLNKYCKLKETKSELKTESAKTVS